MNTIVNKKLICFSDKYYLYCRGPKIYISEGFDNKYQVAVHLPTSSIQQLLGSFRLLSRGLRLEPRCGNFVDDVKALVSYHGAIYRVDCEKTTVTLEHNYRSEMKNTLSFVKLEGLAGFSDGIYYGEYYLNHQSKSVNIYRRDAGGNWTKVYTFQPGEIYHIHGIVPDYKKQCVYVLTGDKDEESGIYEFRNDFKEVQIIVKGKQAYRSCVALPTENGLLYTTDTPLEENFLFHLDFDTKEIKPIVPIPGPSIYGKVLSESEMVFSTSVEPDSRITGIRYEFTNRLGLGVKDRYTHLYYVKNDKDGIHMKEIFKAKKDLLPMGAGQFGTLMFPTGKDEPGKVFVTGQSVRKYDNKTISIDL
jgi:hypothetical protein